MCSQTSANRYVWEYFQYHLSIVGYSSTFRSSLWTPLYDFLFYIIQGPCMCLLGSKQKFKVSSWSSWIYMGHFFFTLEFVYSDYVWDFWATVCPVYVATRVCKSRHWSGHLPEETLKNNNHNHNNNNNKTTLDKGHFWEVFFRGRGM